MASRKQTCITLILADTFIGSIPKPFSQSVCVLLAVLGIDESPKKVSLQSILAVLAGPGGPGIYAGAFRSWTVPGRTVASTNP